MDMIERVARAIHAWEWDGQPHPEPFNEGRQHYSTAAKAAIEAMREPTEEMVEVTGNMPSPEQYGEEGGGWRAAHKMYWKVMIDAALAESRGETP